MHDIITNLLAIVFLYYQRRGYPRIVVEFRKTSVVEMLNFNYKISVPKKTKLNMIGSKFGVTHALASITIIHE